MSPVILIIGRLVSSAAVALRGAIISHRPQGTFAAKPRRVAVPGAHPKQGM